MDVVLEALKLYKARKQFNLEALLKYYAMERSIVRIQIRH